MLIQYTVVLEKFFKNRSFFLFIVGLLVVVSCLIFIYEVVACSRWMNISTVKADTRYSRFVSFTNRTYDFSQFNPNCFFAIPEKTSSISSFAQRYRLAGTFIVFNELTAKSSEDGQLKKRLAILDDLQRKEQFLLEEGSSIPNTAIAIVSIKEDRVTLKEGSREEELLLYFSSVSGDTNMAGMANLSGSEEFSGTPLAKGRFGIQVESNRWVLSRERLLDYYQELLENTHRLAKIYDSLKPVYTENKKIDGYVLEIEGEADTFKELGLQQGDIVRKVNSMAMTSQARAEYFLREFVKNRINGFVIEVERSGKVQHLIYLIR